jgi:hypothetical protein
LQGAAKLDGGVGFALQQPVFDRLLLVAATGLPLCQRYAQQHQQYGRHEGNQPKSESKPESDWHYNIALVNTSLAQK